MGRLQTMSSDCKAIARFLMAERPHLFSGEAVSGILEIDPEVCEASLEWLHKNYKTVRSVVAERNDKLIFVYGIARSKEGDYRTARESARQRLGVQ